MCANTKQIQRTLDVHVGHDTRSGGLGDGPGASDRALSEVLLLLYDSTGRAHAVVQSEDGDAVPDLLPADARDAARRERQTASEVSASPRVGQMRW